MRTLLLALLILGSSGQASGIFFDKIVDAFTGLANAAGSVIGDVIKGGLDIIDTGLDFGADLLDTGIKFGAGVIDAGLNIGANILGSGLQLGAGIIDTAFDFGAGVIGGLVDPLGTWRSTTDDHGHSTGTVVKCSVIADIIFVIDTSSSMDSNEFKLEKQFATRLAEHFNINAKETRFGALVFSDKVQLIGKLNSFSNYQDFKMIIEMSSYLGGGTKTYNALNYINQNRLFSKENGARDRSSKIVVVITDGESDSSSLTSSAARSLRDSGVRVISVGIGSFLRNELHAIASGPDNVFFADHFGDLNKIELRVARRACEIPESEGYIYTGGSGSTEPSCPPGFGKNPSDPSSCLDIDECSVANGCEQKCINLIGKYRCGCNPGFAISPSDPTKCVAIQVCKSQADVFVLIDSSASIGPEDYKRQLVFLFNLAKHFAIGRNGVLFGGIVFATDVKLLFKLNVHNSQGEVGRGFLAAPYLAGGTNTYKAIDYLREQGLFLSDMGGRSAAKDIVIILTDGKSSSEKDTISAAKTLKNQGAKIIAVGIGDQISTDELSGIASASEDVYIVADYSLLDYIEQRLADHICSG